MAEITPGLVVTVVGAANNPTSASPDVRMTGNGSMELRKANKPLMEKRRRARINKSLNELKSILMESMKRNAPGHSKWEKADILEMTVQYLHCLRNQQKANRCDPMSVGQFIAGFSECVRQIQKFNSNEELDRESQRKLTDHLLLYLKSFSDDATKCLQVSPTDRRNSIQRSPSGSLTSLSPTSPDDDSVMSEESSNADLPLTVSMDVCDGTFSTNNSRNQCHKSGIIMNGRNGSPFCNDDLNAGSVWRPW